MEGSARPSAHTASVEPSGAVAQRDLRARGGRSRTAAHAHVRLRRSGCGPRTTGSRRHRAASAVPAPPSARRGRRPAAQATNGSSALATTWVRGAAASAARQRAATMRTSLVRSSWSRDRLSSTTAGGRGRRQHPRQVGLVHLEHGPRRASVPASAATCPGGMFDPVSLLTTSSPMAPSATVSRRVVVVFPFVPVTSATWRPTLRCSSSVGVEPEPGPAAGHRPLAPPEPARGGVHRTRGGAGQPRSHRGGLVRASSSGVGSWRTRDSAGNNALMAFMIDGGVAPWRRRRRATAAPPRAR